MSAIDPNLLTELRHLGSLLYSPEQAAQVLDLTPELRDALSCPGSDIYRAYWAGWYETDIKVRNSILDLAARGSSPAQAMAKKMQQDAEARRFYEG